MKKTVQNLIEDFAQYVIKQNKYIGMGDWKTGNKYAKKYIKCFKAINDIGDKAKNEMLVLLNHENDSVRTMAATFLLRFNTERAIGVLREISKKSGITGFEARESIKRWEEGSWDLDNY